MSLDSLRKSIEGSLKRLGTNYIDLYYQHRIDAKVDPKIIVETMAQPIKCLMTFIERDTITMQKILNIHTQPLFIL
ncbi:aldo/keto reductase [Clostridium baratii]|uniref:aldo/keto reductase n=1 Tax=Clostridium baratii TaxID=1561 RepID=UPI003D351F51